MSLSGTPILCIKTNCQLPWTRVNMTPRGLTHDAAVHVVGDWPRHVDGAEHHDLGRGAGGGGAGHPGEYERACKERCGQKVS